MSGAHGLVERRNDAMSRIEPSPSVDFTVELLDLLERHGYRPENTSPNAALGWALTELRLFLVAFRQAPSSHGT